MAIFNSYVSLPEGNQCCWMVDPPDDPLPSPPIVPIASESPEGRLRRNVGSRLRAGQQELPLRRWCQRQKC